MKVPGTVHKVKFCFCCRNCNQWTHIAMEVSTGTEIHIGCANCGDDVVIFKAIEGIEK